MSTRTCTSVEREQGQRPDYTSHSLRTGCMDGNIEDVKDCLRSLTAGQKENLDGALLGLVISRGHCEIASLLLHAGIRRSSLTENGDTDILLAIRFKRQDILQMLLSSEPDNLNETNTFGVFPLFLAVKLKQVNMFKQLVLAGADVNAKVKTNQINMDGEDFEFLTVSIGDNILLILLRQLGFRMLYQNLNDYYMFLCMFDILIETNIDFTFLDINGHSLLDEAIISLCGIRIIDKLVGKGCSISLPNPYHYACFEDSVERLEIIERLGFDLNAPAVNTPFCPLVVASMDQNVNIVNWFLDKGVDPNASVDAGAVCDWLSRTNRSLVMPLCDVPMCKMTPLHFALMHTMSVFLSAVPIIETLCRHGADINGRTSDGQTPLFYLARYVLGDDNFPITPAHFKTCGSEESIFITLIKAGADPDMETDSGNVPLTFCVPETLSRIALMFLDVSTNLLKYVSVVERNSKPLHISDLTFLNISQGSLKEFIQKPRRLKVLCRKSILKASHGRHVRNESCFESLPQALRNYVTLKYLGEPDWYQYPYTLL